MFYAIRDYLFVLYFTPDISIRHLSEVLDFVVNFGYIVLYTKGLW
jgi:hypothetical protein